MRALPSRGAQILEQLFSAQWAAAALNAVLTRRFLRGTGLPGPPYRLLRRVTSARAHHHPSVTPSASAHHGHREPPA